MSTLKTTKEFAISQEIVAERTDNSGTDIVARQSLADVELVDLETWLASYLDPDQAFRVSDAVFNNTVFLAEPPQEESYCQTFYDVIRAIIVAGKLKEIVDNGFRTYQQMLQGVTAYNETLVYEIVKTSAQDGSEPLQTVWIPNISKLDLLRYIDTQVKYDKEYTYEIFAHQLIVGTRYKYSDLDLNSDKLRLEINTLEVAFDVTCTPSLKVARIPIFKKSARVLDSAPLYPNVDLIPYKGVTDQFLINLSGNSGDIVEDPIIINDTDAEFFEKYRKSRNLAADAPIRFKSDDPTGRFEIYRLSKAPMSYTDFKDNLLAFIGSDEVSSASMIDKIESNTKYYYTFRAIDVHENRSNPTPIYQVEIIESDGMMFFETSIYEFPSPEDAGVFTKPLRRYLKINPSFIQSLYNYDQSIVNETEVPQSAFNVGQAVLGRSEKPVWDKKFKIRVTSKQTGRKFDINLQCTVDYKQLAGEKTPDPTTSTDGFDLPDPVPASQTT